MMGLERKKKRLKVHIIGAGLDVKNQERHSE